MGPDTSRLGLLAPLSTRDGPLHSCPLPLKLSETRAWGSGLLKQYRLPAIPKPVVRRLSGVCHGSRRTCLRVQAGEVLLPVFDSFHHPCEVARSPTGCSRLTRCRGRRPRNSLDTKLATFRSSRPEAFRDGLVAATWNRQPPLRTLHTGSEARGIRSARKAKGSVFQEAAKIVQKRRHDLLAHGKPQPPSPYCELPASMKRMPVSSQKDFALVPPAWMQRKLLACPGLPTHPTRVGSSVENSPAKTC